MSGKWSDELKDGGSLFFIFYFFLDMSEQDKGGSCQTLKMGVSCNGEGETSLKTCM